MKVFVAGATGVVGRRAVEQLVADGHEVTGVARTESKANVLRGVGATPAAVDLFDYESVRGAVSGHDVVVNLATHIPPLAKAARPSAWAENDRLRREASRGLVDAALATAAQRYVQESITFVYPDCGEDWIDEDVPLDTPTSVLTVEAAEAQAARFATGGGAGVVLRFALFYGPDSSHSLLMIRAAERGVGLAMGAPADYVSSIHLDDAASAVVASLRAPSGPYNVGDDEPVSRRAYVDSLGAAVGRRRVALMPGRLGRLGGSRTAMLTRSQRISNARLKASTGWAPAHHSVREGWPAVVAAVG